MNADFVKLVEAEYEKVRNNEPCFYIGEGNPDADILIIGNECARNDNGDDVAADNVQKWKELLKRRYDVEEIRRELHDYKGRHPMNGYYPLFPWFGQRCIVRTEVKKDNEKKIRGDEGTARTWVQYQKLIDWIYMENFNRDKFIDFHLKVFHTELSQIPMMSSGDNDQKDKTADSIQKRLDGLFSNQFFKRFPVVIIAAGHYVRDYGINIIGTKENKRFDVVYKGNIGKSGWINLHESSDSRRLLLHTKHFAAAISDDYIREIAELARPCKTK